MKRIEDYFESNDENNRIIQNALREVDLDTVINLCARLEDKSEMIIRNLSKRVALEVQEELSGERFISVNRKNRSYALFQKKLMRFEYYKRDVLSLRKTLKFNTEEDIKTSLQVIFHLDRENNLDDLLSIIDKIDDDVLKAQLQSIVFADDPLLAEEKIDRIQNRWFVDEKRKMELLKNGIVSILSGEPHELLIEKING